MRDRYFFKIFRFDAKKGEPPEFEMFEVTLDSNASVLEALIEIQDTLDGSLGLRYSCRGAVCGSCAMLINGKFNLACRVKLATLPKDKELLIEPLPNLEIIKDLIVDMAPFWKAYRKVKPFLVERMPHPEKEYLITPKERQGMDQFVNCILCAACYGSCPVIGRDGDYLGPAALAKLYRFAIDSRDEGHTGSIKEANNSSGMWGCDTLFRCRDACPKNVRPTDGITGVRRKLLLNK